MPQYKTKQNFNKQNFTQTLVPSDYKDFFESLSKEIIASATDAEGNIIYANDKFVETSRYTREELMNQNHRILKSGSHDSKFYETLWKTISSGKVWRGEIKNRAKDGTFYWVDTSIAPILDKHGKPVKYVSVRFLITERKQVEEELKRKKEHSEFLAGATALMSSSLDYEVVLKHLAELAVPKIADWCAIDIGETKPNGEVNLRRVAVCHADSSKISLLNQLKGEIYAEIAPFKVFKSGESEFMPEVTEKDLNAVATDDEFKEMLRNLGYQSLLRVPIHHRQKTVGVITLVFGNSGRNYSQGDLEIAEELGRRAGISIENARLYRQLQETDKRKDEFIAALAHELRNPLAPLLLRSELLRSHIAKVNLENDPVVTETASVISRQVKTMSRLLDDLLDISRLMRGKVSLQKSYIDVMTVVNRAIETVKPFFEKQQVPLKVSEPEIPLTIFADPIRIEQVIVNLLNNAAKFSDPGKTVFVEVTEENGLLKICVRDNGLGIEEEMLPKVFDIFTQAKNLSFHLRAPQSGLGIGLALSKSFVELHGGTISAKSDGIGRGSEFIIRLPLSVAHSDENSNKVGILIVDDNTDAAEALAACLRMVGYVNVRIALNGKEAIKVARELLPKYVFMDIRMPVMDGYEAVRIMQEEGSYKETTFVAVTGYGQEEDKRKTEEAGFDHHFIKPVELSSLLKLLPKPR